MGVGQGPGSVAGPRAPSTEPLPLLLGLLSPCLPFPGITVLPGNPALLAPKQKAAFVLSSSPAMFQASCAPGPPGPSSW